MISIVTSGVRSWTAQGFVWGFGLAFALALAISVTSGAAFSQEKSSQEKSSQEKSSQENKSSDFEEKARASIEVEGNKRVDIATVRSYFHASPDGHFDEAARDAALKALIGTHLFENVSIERSGEKLVVHLQTDGACFRTLGIARVLRDHPAVQLDGDLVVA